MEDATAIACSPALRFSLLLAPRQGGSDNEDSGSSISGQGENIRNATTPCSHVCGPAAIFFFSQDSLRNALLDQQMETEIQIDIKKM